MTSEENDPGALLVGGRSVSPGKEEEIRQRFTEHGDLQKLVVNRGYATMSYSRPLEAATAVREEDGAEFHGQTLTVTLKQSGRAAKFLKNLQEESSDAIEVDEEDEEDIVDDDNDDVECLEVVDVKAGQARSRPRSRSRTKNEDFSVFVGGSTICQMHRREVRERFVKYGTIQKLFLTEGYGEIAFSKTEDAKKAIRAEDGDTFFGEPMLVARKWCSRAVRFKRNIKEGHFAQQVPRSLPAPPSILQKQQPGYMPQPQHQPMLQPQQHQPFPQQPMPQPVHQPMRQPLHQPMPQPQLVPPSVQFPTASLQQYLPPPSMSFPNQTPQFRGGGGLVFTQPPPTMMPTPVSSGFRAQLPDTGQQRLVKLDIKKTVHELEILYTDKNCKNYAEFLSRKFRGMKIRCTAVQCSKSALSSIIENLEFRGVKSVILVEPEQMTRRTVSVAVFGDNHRMKLTELQIEQAISLLGKVFDTSTARPPLEEKGSIPREIKKLIGYLFDDKAVSVGEIDMLIKYLADQREKHLLDEHNGDIPDSLLHPPVGPYQDPELKIQMGEIVEEMMQTLSGTVKEVPVSDTLNQAIDQLLDAGPGLLKQIGVSHNPTGPQDAPQSKNLPPDQTVENPPQALFPCFAGNSAADSRKPPSNCGDRTLRVNDQTAGAGSFGWKSTVHGDNISSQPSAPNMNSSSIFGGLQRRSDIDGRQPDLAAADGLIRYPPALADRDRMQEVYREMRAEEGKFGRAEDRYNKLKRMYGERQELKDDLKAKLKVTDKLWTNSNGQMNSSNVIPNYQYQT